MEQVPDTETVPVQEAYQVFINHRGPDVKKTLASLIYHRLINCGLSVFLDKKEIQTGDTLSDAILGAIQSASVHITIFSQSYADSSWCLDELYWILRSFHKCNTKIIPIFAEVEPADLRHIESGSYAKAFEKHLLKGRFTVKVIQKWKTALNQASQISGLRFKANESDHGEFLEEIVNIVLKDIFKWDTLEISKYPVGLEQAAEDFQNEILEQSQPNSTTIVGIAGMGGVGKSTLAKYLYNLRRLDFNGRSCFLSLSDARRRDLPSLQENLLRGLLGNRYFQTIDNIYKGKHILRDRLRRLPRILIVLDDVDNMDQIESLLDVDAVASGSLILITSRDKDLLRRSSSKTVVYDVKPLHKKHARELFCWHAFSQSKPIEQFEDIVEEFLKICGGLPLSLKVLGGLFVGRSDKEYWKGQLENLSTTLPYDIINPLKVSYEALDPEEKKAFLDIGCFLVGEEKELAIRVLEGLYDNKRVENHLESLRQKCLVDFCYGLSDNEIECRKRKNPMTDCNDTCLFMTMHNQLRELARHIAREELRAFPTRNPLRITCSNDMQEMLRSQVGSRTGSTLQVRGIRSSKPCSSDIQEMLPSQARSSLQIRRIGPSKDENPSDMNDIRVEGLRLFVVEGFLFGSWTMRGELVWLRLRNLSSFLFPRSISLRRLRVLEIEGSGYSIEQLFNNSYSDLPWHLNDLKVVCTRGSTCMDFDLNVVDTRGSTSTGFPAPGQTESSRKRKYIVPGIRQYESPFFRYLKSMVTGMRALTRLVLKNLGSLQSLPIDFSELQNIRHLDLSGCHNLSKLPSTFSELMQLHYLAFQDCMNLSIPLDIFGEISTLEYVNFKGCEKLVGLPEGIPYQKHLRYLNLLHTSLLQLPGKLENTRQFGTANNRNPSVERDTTFYGQFERLKRVVSH